MDLVIFKALFSTTGYCLRVTLGIFRVVDLDPFVLRMEEHTYEYAFSDGFPSFNKYKGKKNGTWDLPIG